MIELNALLDQSGNLILDWLKQQDMQSVPSISANKVSEIHHIAYYLYQDQQYEKATHFFRLLTMINPLETDYWQGLAASLQLNKKYKEAIESYISALLINQNEPDPYIYVYAADCYFSLNQVEQGLKTLEGAKTSAKQQGNKQVLNHVNFMQKLWSKNIK